MGGGIGGESLFFNSVLQSALPWDMVGLMMPYSNIRVQWSQFLLQGLIRSLGPHGFWDEVVGLIFPLLYVKLSLSPPLTSFQIFPLFLVFCRLNLKYSGVGVFFVCFPVWCSPSFLDLWFDINLGKFVVIVASNISFRFLIFPLYLCNTFSVRFSHSVMSDSWTAWTAVTPWTAAHQASLSITHSQSLLKLMSIESVMPSNHLILCHLLPPSIFPSIMVFYGVRNGNPLQYSCLESPMNRGAWQATVHRVAKSQTRLSMHTPPPFIVVSQLLSILFCFFFFFPVFVSLCFSLLKFSINMSLNLDCFLNCVQSADKLIKSIFISVTVFLVSSISFWFLEFLSLCRHCPSVLVVCVFH